jgi:hypothetical protein
MDKAVLQFLNTSDRARSRYIHRELVHHAAFGRLCANEPSFAPEKLLRAMLL